jgi:hypothetical protein
MEHRTLSYPWFLAPGRVFQHERIRRDAGSANGDGQYKPECLR